MKTAVMKPIAPKSVRAAGAALLPMLLAACGGSGGGGTTATPSPTPTPTPPPAQTVQGTVFDGPIEGATVFRDENGNGVQDGDEPFAVSDANGTFEIVEGTADLIATGGVDTVTGFDFSGTELSAQSDASVINMLTTLINAAADPADFAARIGIPALETFDTSFDPLTYSPFAAANASKSDLNEFVIFLNQAAQITVSLIEVIAEVSGTEDPRDFAIETLANNAGQVPEDSIGIFTEEGVVISLASDLINSGILADRTLTDVAEALENLSEGYALLLGQNTEPADSAIVQAIVQEAVITVESLIQDLASDSGILPRDYTGIFPNTSDLNEAVTALAARLATFGNNISIASRDGSNITGTPLNDFIRGRLGDDVLDGAGGDDYLAGEQGVDTLLGGAGDDTIVKGFGSGSVDGGAGDDVIVVQYSSVDVAGGPGFDTLDLSGATPRGFFFDPPTFTIDLVDQVYSLSFQGSEVFVNAIASIERIELAGSVNVTFRGTDQSETIDAFSGHITVIPSGGDDVVTQSFVNNPLIVTADFSSSSEPVTLAFDQVTGALSYDFGTLSTPSNFEAIIGSNQGDTISLSVQAGAVFLGEGADTLVIPQRTVGFIENFSSTGPVQDKIDLSQLPGAADMFPDIESVLDSFLSSTVFENGEEIPRATLRIVENGTSSDISFGNVNVADIGPENIILPVDVL